MNNMDNKSSTNHQNIGPTIAILPPLPNAPSEEAQQQSEQQQISPEISSRSSSQWVSDLQSKYCYACQSEFNALNRKHHCRLCGLVFCNNCSNTRSLIPPRKIRVSIVLSC